MGKGNNMRMGMLGGSGGEPWQGQVMTITPPIAMDEDTAVANAQVRQSRRLSQEGLGELGKYITQEDPSKPYSVSQIVEHMGCLGYRVTRQDIGFAKNLIELERD